MNDATSNSGGAERCYHCWAPVPAGVDLDVEIDGARRAMCCHGCAAVASAIVEAGLDDYYRLRTAPAATGADLVPGELDGHRVYDHPEMQRGAVAERGDGKLEATLILDGIDCAACAWLIERRLAALPGVAAVEVNYASHRARTSWDPRSTRLSSILDEVRRIGYAARPYDADARDHGLDEERRVHIRRLAIAGLLAVQIMMLAAGLYLGDWMGMDARFRSLFQWASLVLAVPVLLYPAAPFFRGAWRGIRNREPGMDLPVALGIAIAFAGSALATLTGGTDVYFDSVAMFAFFLLLARYLEFEARRRNVQVAETVVHARPETAWRIDPQAAEGTCAAVPAAVLEVGDRVLVRPGEPIPADGRIEQGRSSVDESLLSGESRPLERGPGDAVLAGSVNYDQPLTVRVERTGADTVRAHVLALVERAQAQRPPQALLADRVAGRFVLAVIALAGLTALYWWSRDPDRALEVTVAVLVVTCPCALSLATPVAHTVAVTALARRGVLATRGAALETLARVERLIFDKTGTLTTGRLRVRDVIVLDGLDRDGCLAIAAALESRSEHPLARAIVAAAPRGAPVAEVEVVANRPGAGLVGTIDGREVAIGSPEFVAGQCAAAPPSLAAIEPSDTVVMLADRERWLAAFALADELRADAAASVAALRASGVEVSLYSGDRPQAAAAAAAALAIEDAAGGLAPADKLERMRARARPGEIVAAVGDGINDAPVLAGADVSVAMGAGAALAKARADLVLIGDRLADLTAGIEIARAARTVVRQNLGWAIAYNLLAIPAAVAGWVPPWLAALGMSASSLAVVANSLRIRRAGSRGI